MSKPLPLPPFQAFLASNIPSVYDNTLSYNDELTKLIAYLEQVILPAVDETAGQVDGIKKGLEELKSYVDNYFENLDVQEEINNKLDDMAEHGELATIIAMFLAAAPVFGYATISDMAAATNLVSGCVARVIGNTTASDGDGAYYIVRAKEPGESADGVIKVAIGDDLIADRIQNALYNELNARTNRMSTILDSNAGVFVGTFFDNGTTTLRIVTSQDGYNFTRILPDYAPSTRDPQLTYINGKFYIVSTSSGTTTVDGKLYVSEDLVNWTTKTFSMGLTSYDQKWAPEIFVDTNDKIYFTVAAGTVNAKSLYIAECTDIDNLTFTGLRQLHSTGTGTVAIDANICKKGNVYYLGWCEQGTAADGTATSICKIASSVDLTNWTTINNNVFTELPFVEGMQIVPANDRFLIIGDAVSTYHYYVERETYDLANTSGLGVSDLQYVPSLIKMRHGSITYIDDETALNVLAEATEGENPKLINNINKIWNTGVNLSGTITNFIAQPNVAYRITDNTTITNLYNPFKLDRISFAFATSAGKTLTITNIQNAEGTTSERNRTVTNSAELNEHEFDLSLLGHCYWFK